MGWKNFPSWLKGGIIVLALITFLFLILFVMGAKNTTNLYNSDKISYSQVTPLYAYLIPNFLRIPLNTYSQTGTLLSFIGRIIEGFILWFVVGALIGFIVGKIKSRGKR